MRALALAAVLLAAGGAGAGDPRVFDMPVLARGIDAAEARLDQGDGEAALEIAETLLARFPELGALHILRARAAAATGRTAKARASALLALQRGVRPGRLDRAARLAPLLGGPLFARRVARFRAAPRPPPRPAWRAPAEPAPVRDGVATVTPASTEWAADEGRLLVRLGPDPRRRARGRPALPRDVARRLAGLVASGRAAGNLGDFYDNHDRDHSSLRRGALPGLAFVEYGPAARARRLDHGAVTGLGFDRPVFGNSSTAITGGTFWRSQARQLMTQPGGPAEMFAQYASNQLYVYPEHRDHDPERGDLFPANTPYVLVSQGSSGSDRAFLRAVGVILAALPPRAKARAEAEGLLAPLVQAVLREAMAPGAYLSGTAHPSALAGTDIPFDRLIDIAQRQRPETLAPMPRLDVLAEPAAEPGRTLFSGGLGERLFDTPSAIARVHRRTDQRLELTVSAAATRDPNGRALRFAWRVLRGDAARIRIRTEGPGARIATLSIPWHDPFPVPGDPTRLTHRVDIGVFAHNGAGWSAPAFISVAYPPRQQRAYDTAGRVREITYPGRASEGYADPRLFPRHGWRDVYHRGPDGRLLGWTRHRGQRSVDYTPAGRRVTARGPGGAVAESVAVTYRLVRDEAGHPRIAVEPAPPGTAGP